MAKRSISIKARSTKSKAIRKVAEFKDKLRRRKTTAAHKVGATKESHVLIQEPTIINLDGKEVFQAKFVAPRLGSPLNPYPDHVIAIAIQTAVHQAVIGSLKKFREVSRTAIPLSAIEKLRIRKLIPQGAGVLIRLEELKMRGNKFKKFNCQVVNEENNHTVYIQGNLTVKLVPKDQPKTE